MIPEKLRQVLEATKSLPSAPSVLAKIHAMTLDNDTGAHQLEDLIQLDPALTTSVLRMANSGFFANSQRCDSVREAILRLGTATLYQLAAAAVAGRWLTHPVEGYGWRPGDLCRHSLCVAVAAEAIARRTQLANPNIAYTAGLMHDVGKLALAHARSPDLNRIAALVPEKHANWRDAEQEILGFTSADVTAHLLQKWGFSGALVSVGACHMLPSSAPEEHKPIVTLIHASKHLAIQLGFGVGIDGFFCEIDEPALRFQRLEAETLHMEVPKILERLQRVMDPTDGIRAAM